MVKNTESNGVGVQRRRRRVLMGAAAVVVLSASLVACTSDGTPGLGFMGQAQGFEPAPVPSAPPTVAVPTLPEVPSPTSDAPSSESSGSGSSDDPFASDTPTSNDDPFATDSPSDDPFATDTPSSDPFAAPTRSSPSAYGGTDPAVKALRDKFRATSSAISSGECYSSKFDKADECSKLINDGIALLGQASGMVNKVQDYSQDGLKRQIDKSAPYIKTWKDLKCPAPGGETYSKSCQGVASSISLYISLTGIYLY